MSGDTILSIFLGIGLAASVGFRVFLPLLVLSLAAYNGLWELNESWQWLGSLTAVITFGVASLVELFAYFFPWLDHLLDSLALPLAGLAGTAVMVSTVAGLDPVVTWSLAIIAGGGHGHCHQGGGSRGAPGIHPEHGRACQPAGGRPGDRYGRGNEPGLGAGTRPGRRARYRGPGPGVPCIPQTATRQVAV